MNGKPIIAIMYDFDKTLCTKDMQGYGFIPSLGITEEEFWNYANEIGHKEHMDSILAYMYAMVKISKDKNIPLLSEYAHQLRVEKRLRPYLEVLL